MSAHPPGETISVRETASPLPAKLARIVAARFAGQDSTSADIAHGK